MNFSTANFIVILLREYPGIGEAAFAGRQEHKLRNVIKGLIEKCLQNEDVEIEDEEEMDMDTDTGDYDLADDNSHNPKMSHKALSMSNDEDEEGENSDLSSFSINDEDELETDQQSTDEEEDAEEDEDLHHSDLKRPTSFRFIDLDSVKDFDLLWLKMTSDKPKSSQEFGTMGERLGNLEETEDREVHGETAFGGKSITFTLKKSKKPTKEDRQKQHVQERKQVRRSAGEVMRFVKPMRKRGPIQHQGKKARTGKRM